jgi:hypothetical protein
VSSVVRAMGVVDGDAAETEEQTEETPADEAV